MKCPKCGETLPFIICTNCGREYPEKGAFCCWCGHPSASETAHPQDNEADFSERKLCSDGACIGVINEKGVCGVCGKPYSGEAG